MKKSLLWENTHDDDDYRNVYNPDVKPNPFFWAQTSAPQSLAAIEPNKQRGLEAHIKDVQYEVPHQLKKSLLWENTHDDDDYRNVYNPDVKPNPFFWAQKTPGQDAP